MMACGGVWSSLEEGRPSGVQKEIPIRNPIRFCYHRVMDSIRLQTAAIDHLKPRRFGRSRAAAAAVLSALVACAPMIVQAAHAVSGRVADDQGAGIDGVEVRFYTEDSLNCLAPVATCVTQSDGAYTCPVEAGEYYLAAFPPVESLFAFEFYPDTYPMRSDFAPTTVAADLAGLDFALEQGGRVRLQLLTEAGEIPPFQLYVHVRFQNERGGTWWDDRRYDGQTGQYYSEVFPAGDYILLLTHAGQAADYVDPQYYCGAAAEERATNVTISRGSTIDLGECRLISAEPNGAIAGTVQGADAAPLAGIPVVAYQAEWHVIASTETDQNGAFELEVPRNGEYKIAAEPGPPSFHTRAYYPGFSLFSEGDWVEEGRTDIHFQLGVGGRVRFTLTGEAGSALGFACPVSIFDREQGSTPVVAEGRSDSSGIFISPTLPGGSYSFVLGPPAGSGYLPTQGFCQQYDHQGADIVSVTPEQTADLGELCADRRSLRAGDLGGYLFAYDHEWIRNRCQFPHFNAGAAAVGDLNGDGLIDIVTSSVDAVSSTMGI